jgi:transcriptional regulator with XRE-family HTH domain
VGADHVRTTGTTRLAKRRLELDLRQTDVARAAGLSDRNYQRLESGRLPNPGIRYLVACAMALDCKLSDIIEDDWLEFWTDAEGMHGQRAAAAVSPLTGAPMSGQRLERQRI